MQVVENYTEGDDKQFPLITYVAVESADCHGARSLLPALEKLKQRNMSPQEILADSLYSIATPPVQYSDTNCEKALHEHDVAVIAPASCRVTSRKCILPITLLTTWAGSLLAPICCSRQV